MFESFFYMINSVMLMTGGVENPNSFPLPLSAEDEKKYIALAVNGDKEARDKLIIHNMRLVVHIAKKYTNYPDQDELISVGAMGLIKAISKFDPSKNTQLATYASTCIENEILMILRSSKRHRKNMSLNDTVGVDKDGNTMSLIDTLVKPVTNDLIDDIHREKQIEKLRQYLKNDITPKEFNLLKLRYGYNNEKRCMPQREVAKIMGISRSYVSRIESKALKKLRKKLEEDDML